MTIEHCPGSSKPPIPGTDLRLGPTVYADCTVCGDRPPITARGVTRKHPKGQPLRQQPAAP